MQLESSAFLQQSNCYQPGPTQIKTETTFKYNKPGYGVDFHPLTNIAVCGNQENIINAFKVDQSGQILKDGQNFSAFEHGSVEDVRFAHTGSLLTANVFAAASTSGCVQIIDPRDHNRRNIVQLSQADINVIDFDY